MKLARILLLAASTALLARDRAKVVPDLHAPERFAETAEGISPGAAELAEWWKQFQDPQLDSLVARALSHNIDLRIAASRIAEARAAERSQRSALLPNLGLSNSFNRIRGGFSQGNVHVASGGTLIAPFDTNNFQAGFDASWELDFFGGNRRALEASKADFKAREEARRDVMVTVAAEVARNYVELRGLDARIAITQRNIRSQQETLELSRIRAEAGLGTQLDVERQAAQLATTMAAEPSLEGARAQTVHRLGVLLGEPPSALLEELRASAAIPHTPASTSTGIPAELLNRRPDLRQAQAELDAAAARVGVAKASLYPKIVISGLSGRQTTDLGGFTLGAGNFFSFGPGIQLPIFNGGRLRSNIAVQDARLNQVKARYEANFLNALEEVEDALSGYGKEEQRRAKLALAVEASRTSVELANELYLRGLSDFISVLDAQRVQYAAEEDLAQSETTVVTKLVTLYKALGGGWN